MVPKVTKGLIKCILYFHSVSSYLSVGKNFEISRFLLYQLNSDFVWKIFRFWRSFTVYKLVDIGSKFSTISSYRQHVGDPKFYHRSNIRCQIRWHWNFWKFENFTICGNKVLVQPFTEFHWSSRFQKHSFHRHQFWTDKKCLN